MWCVYFFVVHARPLKNTMTKMTISALIAAITFIASVSSASDEPMAAELSEEQQVHAVQQEWVDAEVGRDETALNRVLDERFVINSSSGTPETKESVIASVLGLEPGIPDTHRSDRSR